MEKELLKDWIALGLLAAERGGMADLALAIFQAVSVADPENPACVIGIGLAMAGSKGGPEAAAGFMMDEGVTADSGEPMARAFLSLYLALAKRSQEAERVARAVIGDESDADAVELAEGVLQLQILK